MQQIISIWINNSNLLFQRALLSYTNGNVTVISITPINNQKSVPFSKAETKQKQDNKALVDAILSSTGVQDSKKFAEEGSEFLKRNEFDNAINSFKKSIELRPEFSDTYYDLAKSYKYNEDYDNAIPTFEKYLESKPNDVEANILLGECYNQQGFYNKAKVQFVKATSLDANNDLAKRNLLETQNLILGCYDPATAMNEKRQQSINNLNKAISMAKEHLSAGYLKDLADITVAFDKTALMGGTSNIAQYEHSKRKITVTDKYVYASPQLICSYLVHEFVHAKDKDPFTSVTEEQDAYRKATEYWLEHSRGTKDPEMDYAADLYKTSPKTLDDRVCEIYMLRDPKIAKVSPNHPPSSQKAAAGYLNELNCGQPIRTYDVIS